MTKLWGWFLGTKAGRWIVGVFAVVGALIAALAIAFVKGKHSQAAKDKAKDAEAAQQGAQVAQQTFTAATDAAAKVQADAAKQAPPDPVERDDFDTNF